jgi:hypothetical protein
LRCIPIDICICFGGIFYLGGRVRWMSKKCYGYKERRHRTKDRLKEIRRDRVRKEWLFEESLHGRVDRG